MNNKGASLIEVIGIIDDVIYNFINLLFILVCNACYQNSSRPDDVPIHNACFANNGKVVKDRPRTKHIKEM